MSRVSHHLLLCATPGKALCCPDPAIGAASWDTLKRLVREWGLEDPQRPEGIVLRSKADCLRICAEGPVLLIWPEGSVYGGVTPERIERILREHVITGQPIEAWMLRRYGLAAGTSPQTTAARSSSQAAAQRSDQQPRS
jgi:(2Fe-2S) ferredoxin